MDYYSQIKDYFNQKAGDYDDVDKQLYWVLSDKFFKKVLSNELKTFFDNREDAIILDAGAGTGRWTFILEELFGEKIKKGLLVDISEKMLAEAKKKIIKHGLSVKYSCEERNIEKLDSLNNEFFDLAISFYNVISFVENPHKALQEISKKLKNGGIFVSIVANKYHSYYFSILTNRLNEMDNIREKSLIKFNDAMPAIHCFTPEEAKKLYFDNGFSEVNVFGGPNFIYPGMEETKIIGNTQQIFNKLSDNSNFEKILSIELENYKNSDISGRANTLLIIAKK
jgi:ubiquinone/menaquinone biosynthesis C-methylase UbiE